MRHGRRGGTVELSTDSPAYRSANKDRHRAWGQLKLILEAETLEEAKVIAKVALLN